MLRQSRWTDRGRDGPDASSGALGPGVRQLSELRIIGDKAADAREISSSRRGRGPWRAGGANVDSDLLYGTDAPSCARRRPILDEAQRGVKLSSSGAFPALWRRPEATDERGPPIGPRGIVFSASQETHTVQRLDTRAHLLDTERMLADGAANVAAGFHVETGLSGLAAKAVSFMSIKVGSLLKRSSRQSCSISSGCCSMAVPTLP